MVNDSSIKPLNNYNDNLEKEKIINNINKISLKKALINKRNKINNNKYSSSSDSEKSIEEIKISKNKEFSSINMNN